MIESYFHGQHFFGDLEACRKALLDTVQPINHVKTPWWGGLTTWVDLFLLCVGFCEK